MGWTIEGAGGAQWAVSTWAGRNALHYLLPALREARFASAVAALEAGAASGLCRASLCDVLADERHAKLFKLAIDAALAAIERDGPAGWHDPHAYGPFVAAFTRLKSLCRGDGNELVIELAAHPLNFSHDHVTRSMEAFSH